MEKCDTPNDIVLLKSGRTISKVAAPGRASKQMNLFLGFLFSLVTRENFLFQKPKTTVFECRLKGVS